MVGRRRAELGWPPTPLRRRQAGAFAPGPTLLCAGHWNQEIRLTVSASSVRRVVMSPTLHPDRVDDHGASWVAAGLITEEQLDSIRRFEHLDDTDDRRLSVAAEVAVYLGSVLALSGGAMVVARRWEELAFAARLGVALVIAAAGIAGGVWSYRQGEPGTDRVGGFLSALGLAGVAFASGLVVIRADAGADELAVLVPGVAVIAVGAVLWRNRTRPLEFLAVVAASVAVVTAVVSLADLDVWVGGMTILLLGFAPRGRVRDGARPPAARRDRCRSRVCVRRSVRAHRGRRTARSDRRAVGGAGARRRCHPCRRAGARDARRRRHARRHPSGARDELRRCRRRRDRRAARCAVGGRCDRSVDPSRSSRGRLKRAIATIPAWSTSSAQRVAPTSSCAVRPVTTTRSNSPVNSAGRPGSATLGRAARGAAGTRWRLRPR
ncbi:MAG: hypothetical protein CL424_12260 [Acidimicrobiaceae bacterium]|nr:hypothetical protein [Acidimicrobiaceae bacterium]